MDQPQSAGRVVVTGCGHVGLPPGQSRPGRRSACRTAAVWTRSIRESGHSVVTLRDRAGVYPCLSGQSRTLMVPCRAAIGSCASSRASPRPASWPLTVVAGSATIAVGRLEDNVTTIDISHQVGERAVDYGDLSGARSRSW